MSQTLNQIFSHVGLTKSELAEEPAATRPQQDS